MSTHNPDTGVGAMTPADVNLYPLDKRREYVACLLDRLEKSGDERLMDRLDRLILAGWPDHPVRTRP